MRRVRHEPAPLDERLDDQVEVHRAQPRGVHRGAAGRDPGRAQQRRREMGVVAAHAAAGREGAERRVGDRARARHVLQMPGHPGDDRVERLAALPLPHDLLGDVRELVHLAVARGAQVQHRVRLEHPRGRGRRDAVGVVGDLDLPAGQTVQEMEPVAEAVARLGHRVLRAADAHAERLPRRGGVRDAHEQRDVRPLLDLGPHPCAHVSFHPSSVRHARTPADSPLLGAGVISGIVL